MSLVDKLSDAFHELIEEGCPNIRDPYTGRRCGRRRYTSRRCFACAEMTSKPLDLVVAHAAEYGLSLRGAFLDGATLAGGELRWLSVQHARLRGADLTGADVRSTDFSEADLTGASFRGADLTHARLRQVAGITGARFQGAVLEEAALTVSQAAGLEGASFEHADLTRARLADARLTGVSFRGARLVSADLRRTDLSGADFSGADLTDADLSGAELAGAIFEGALLERTRFPGGKAREDVQKEAAPADAGRGVLGKCMRAFAAIAQSSDRTKLRVLARKVFEMPREEALDLILPILEKEDVTTRFAEEAIAALRALGRDPSTRPFLVGLLSRGAEEMRLESASILAEPPLDEETSALFESILTAGESTDSFRQGVFRALAPGIEDRDPGSLALATALLERGEYFEGELLSALGQAGAIDERCRAEMVRVAGDRSLGERTRLAAARELSDQFFGEDTCRLLGRLLASEEESVEFRRSLFWFVARRVACGEEPAVSMARGLLERDREIEADIRWALAESGDREQAAYFLKVAQRGAELGWQETGPQDGSPEAPVYDDLVRAAQVLGKIGPVDAVPPLAALIRRDRQPGAAPPGAPFSLTDAARDAILELRRSYGPAAVADPGVGDLRDTQVVPPPPGAEPATQVIPVEAGTSSQRDTQVLLEGDLQERPESTAQATQKLPIEEMAEALAGPARASTERQDAQRSSVGEMGHLVEEIPRAEEARMAEEAHEGEEARQAEGAQEAQEEASTPEERLAAAAQDGQEGTPEERLAAAAREAEDAQAAEEEARRKAEEEEARRRAEEEEARRKAEEEEARRRAEEEEARRKAEEEEARRRAEEEEARRKAEEEEARRRAEEEEARRKAEEEEARRRAEEEAQRKAEEEARLKAEEEARRAAEEAAKTKAAAKPARKKTAVKAAAKKTKAVPKKKAAKKAAAAKKPRPKKK